MKEVMVTIGRAAVLALLASPVLGRGVIAATAGQEQELASRLDACNVVWDSPGTNSSGSVPIGNGDVGANVWVEPSGDLVFYLSKTDAWDENGRLCKIGRVRVKFTPSLVVTNGFRQELRLAQGRIDITTGNGVRMGLWVDAHSPVVRLEAESETPVDCRAEVELWRLRDRPFGPGDDSHSGGGLSAQACKPVVLPDVVVTSAVPRVACYHRNTRSVYELSLQVQHLAALKGRFADPLWNLTFGASLSGKGFVSDGKQAIEPAAPAKRQALSVTVLTAQTDTPEAWLAILDQLERKAGKLNPARARLAHESWWREFWDRSWIFVNGAGTVPLPTNAHPWRVGVASDGRSRFSGAIAGPRVIGRALSAAEIAQFAGQQPATETRLDEETLATGCTVAAWIKPAGGEAGRILDKCTAGKADGITFVTFPALALRWIVGDHTIICPAGLKPGEWQHVAATADAGTGVRRIYLNGKLVKEERDDSAAETVTRGYVLQRFMNACSGRGGPPIKFNGSIFTVEAKPGASPETP
ncbi:MAG: DUF5703 domain-containing protein, partial [Verrucomicrobia bacterium]|nr:DUF5703 domain-containing protein [Verrucomicrobiota bacterium]